MKRWVVAIVSSLMLLSASPAGGWSNGVNGCNSFGTHDWILKKAIRAAGEKASWVRVRVALRATDDPDCVDGIDHASGSWWHVYDEWGETYGDAPEAAEVWFERMSNRLQAGNERGASRALGILAHIVGDVAQPMHTDSRPREERVHGPYESAVDRRVSDYRFTYDGRDGANPRARSLRVARVAHNYYFELVRAYDNHSYNAKVHRITKRQLNRAGNAMADLLTSL